MADPVDKSTMCAFLCEYYCFGGKRFYLIVIVMAMGFR